MPDWFVNLAYFTLSVFMVAFLIGIALVLFAVGKIALDEYKEERREKERGHLK